ncbi:unnamed protein product [Brachionus calyciflorus]|uniref:Uncharacterized protein n=1 Tax=Brachionus calyciflorus TaxID=104777 RepID=A0A813ZT51_9BILA|nr:unnamed protein product [Brachionus calyciflorus]
MLKLVPDVDLIQATTNAHQTSKGVYKTYSAMVNSSNTNQENYKQILSDINTNLAKISSEVNDMVKNRLR